MATTLQKLLKVQAELKAPKSQFNKFGGYKFRSCEDILEAVKPLLEKQKLVMTLTDELVEIAGRFYVKATATIFDAETDNIVTNSICTESFAREEESKKGMDGSQITGGASSYARKYALNGLFLIDDTKDADATNKGQETASEKVTEACSDCGKAITSHKGKGKDGKMHTWSAEVIAENSKAKTGRCLCWDCWMKEADRARAQAEKQAYDMDAEYKAILHEDAGDRI